VKMARTSFSLLTSRRFKAAMASVSSLSFKSQQLSPVDH
jgi:hypothetical protein